MDLDGKEPAAPKRPSEDSIQTAAPTPAVALTSDATVQGSGRVPVYFPPEPQSHELATAPLGFEERYALAGELARGGMGRVVVAQDRLIGRGVAIKEVLNGKSAHTVARFVRESLMTARLQHPSIIPVYEVGRRATGEPFIVMRHVSGKPLSELAHAAKNLSERLQLLPRVLPAIDALAYAHQRNIIHRDLKPANILVGDFGETVVIDWGLAKNLADPDAASASDELVPAGDDAELTMSGSVLGTPTYMAPEQARGEKADKRSDVYSLGAVLYEVLSGRSPFPGDSSRDVLKRVIEQPPPPLGEIAPGLPTDLITIVRTAMEREPAKRFASAGELAEQLRSFQAGRLVSAHRYSAGELLGRFIQRNRVVLAVAAAALVALAVLAAISVRRIVAERDRANTEAESSKRVADFLTGMFQVSSPSEARGNSVTAREVLDRASKEIEDGLAKEPLVQAQLMMVMGSVYTDLGLLGRAEELLRKSLGIRRRLLGDDDAKTTHTLTALGSVVYQEGRYPDADPLMREAFARARKVFGEDSREALAAEGNLANLVDDETHFAEAETMMRDAIERRTRVFGSDNRDTLAAKGNLASVLSQEGHDDEAIVLLQGVLADEERVLGADHPATLEADDMLALLLLSKSRFAEAEKVELKSLAGSRRVNGPEHPQTLAAMTSLAAIYNDEGRHADAEKVARDAVAIDERQLGAKHPDTLNTKLILGAALSGEGKFKEADALLNEVIKLRREISGPEHMETLYAMAALGRAYESEGRYDDAEAITKAALEGRRKTLGPDHPDTAGTIYDLAALEAARGDKEKAFAYLNEAVLHKLSPPVVLGIPKDQSMKLLWGDPRLDALVAAARAKP